MNHFKLAAKSAFTRKTGIVPAMLSVAVAVLLLLGFDRISKDANANFAKSVSGVDLIVGARTGPVNLLLQGVFQYGAASANLSYETFQTLADRPEVSWAMPVSWGDSHRGHRIMGTNADFFAHYRHGNSETLKFEKGGPFADLYDAVIGHEVAQRLGYGLGREIVATHGLATGHGDGENRGGGAHEHGHGEHSEEESLALKTGAEALEHSDKPFRVVGILKKTGTALDKNLFVSLRGMEAMHLGWESGAPSPISIPADWARKLNLEPKSVTMFFVGLKDRKKALRLAREINDYEGEALTAIIPAVELVSFWNLIAGLENALAVFSGLVMFTSLLGMLIVLLSTLNERRREMAILKTLGAKARHFVGLFALESAFIMLGGCALGVGLLYALILFAGGWVAWRFGIYLSLSPPDAYQLSLLAAASAVGVVFSAIPAALAYRRTLKDGLAVKY